LNALVIISTLYTSDSILYNGYSGEVTAIINSENLSQVAFGSALDLGNFEGFGAQFITLCLFLFTFSTILVSYIFGKMNIIYLFGTKADNFYVILVLLLIFIGAFTGNELMWEINNLANGFMIIPNVLALFVLTDIVKNSATGRKK